ncbi:MAG: hypothetical protein CMK59_05510 [Proteobacteria bacterium]|nr:hypothetical protein [Pseudomonadota bacterium]
MSVKISSIFSGIGTFELGMERSIPNSKTIWQCEIDPFCQKILRKHWPDTIIYDDVRCVLDHDPETPDILLGSYPCQDLSNAGSQGGIYAERSGLYWNLWSVISALLPRVVVLENVAAHTIRGGREVVGSLTQLGYDCEWGVIRSGGAFGAPHRRERLFIVAYSMRKRRVEHTGFSQTIQPSRHDTLQRKKSKQPSVSKPPHGSAHDGTYWTRHAPPSKLCRMDDGIAYRMDRIRSLGNAIVPQCAEWIGQQIWRSGILSSN